MTTSCLMTLTSFQRVGALWAPGRLVFGGFTRAAWSATPAQAVPVCGQHQRAAQPAAEGRAAGRAARARPPAPARQGALRSRPRTLPLPHPALFCPAAPQAALCPCMRCLGIPKITCMRCLSIREMPHACTVLASAEECHAWQHACW